MPNPSPIPFGKIIIGDILYEIDDDGSRYGPILVIFSRGATGFIGMEMDHNTNQLVYNDYLNPDIPYIHFARLPIDEAFMRLARRLQ